MREKNCFSPQQEKADLQMKDINHDRIGSTLDDLLESEGELTEITALAHKLLEKTCSRTLDAMPLKQGIPHDELYASFIAI